MLTSAFKWLISFCACSFQISIIMFIFLYRLTGGDDHADQGGKACLKCFCDTFDSDRCMNSLTRRWMSICSRSMVRRTSWSPGMVRHVLPYWWRIVPSWKQKVLSQHWPICASWSVTLPWVRHKVRQYSLGPSFWCAQNDVRHGSVIFMKWCVIILTQICVNVFKWRVTVSDGGCVMDMVYKWVAYIGTMTYHSRGSRLLQTTPA